MRFITASENKTALGSRLRASANFWTAFSTPPGWSMSSRKIDSVDAGADAPAAGGIVDELVDWVRRESEQPLHDFRHAEIGIIVRHGHEQRHFRGSAKKLPASRVGSFGKQNERFHFRMICSNVDGLIDAATCAADGDHVSRYSKLGDEVLVGGLDVGGDF